MARFQALHLMMYRSISAIFEPVGGTTPVIPDPAPTTQAPTTQAPTTQAPTTQDPDPATQVPQA